MKSRVKSTDDPRYKNIQSRFNRIIENFICRGRITKLKVSSVSARARVSTSTFYDHYKDMDEAIAFSNTRMREALAQLNEEIGNSSDLEIIYLKILFFIHKNQDYYKMAVSRQNALPFVQILDVFQPTISHHWKNYNRSERELICQIFGGEFIGIVMYWGQSEQFKKSRIHAYAKKLAKLNKTAHSRLR